MSGTGAPVVASSSMQMPQSVAELNSVMLVGAGCARGPLFIGESSPLNLVGALLLSLPRCLTGIVTKLLMRLAGGRNDLPMVAS